jgi:hypothetical protein
VHVPSLVAPSDLAQTSQLPAQAVSQHTPSEQCADAHAASLAHGCPSFGLHAPVGSQVTVPVHESGSSVPVTAAPNSVEHVPGVARSQSWQTPHDAVSQHTPSTQ